MIGEFLYRLADQEARSAPVLQRVIARASPAATLATTIGVTVYTVPSDKVLLLKSLFAAATSGAAQTNDLLQWTIQADFALATFISELAARRFTPALLNSETFFFPDDTIIMPGESLTVTGIFSAAGAANRVTGAVNGILMPKGNVQLR